MRKYSTCGILFAGLLTAFACSMLLAAAAEAARRVEIKRIVINEAAQSNVPVPLALAVAKVESDFNARALSSAGARGVMQIMPATGQQEFGLTADQLWNPRTNIRTGIRFLEQLHRQYGQRWDLALSHYNGGTLKGRGARARAHSYTRKYVANVFRWRDVYSEQSLLWQPQGKKIVPLQTAKIKPLSDNGDLQSAIDKLQAELQRREDDYYDQRPEPVSQSLFREYYDRDEEDADKGDFADEGIRRTAMIDDNEDMYAQRWHEQNAPILRLPEIRHRNPGFEPQKFRRMHPVFRRHPSRRHPWK